MHELTDLYGQLITDHYRSPRNRRRLEPADRAARGDNPLCGDIVMVYLALDGDTIADVAFEGKGCAISTAAASMMTQAVKGKTLDEARALFERFHGLVTGKADDDPDGEGPELGKLMAFAGVRWQVPRIKCATLVWHTLKAALDGSTEIVSTE